MNEDRTKHWILDEEHHLKKVDLLTWAQWIEQRQNMVVQQDWVGPLFVSTVFLGLDHNFMGKGPPIVFETMVFVGNGGHDEMCWRYSSWDDAITGHQMALKKAREWVMNNPLQELLDTSQLDTSRGDEQD